jgi:hypothetical protein
MSYQVRGELSEQLSLGRAARSRLDLFEKLLHFVVLLLEEIGGFHSSFFLASPERRGPHEATSVPCPMSPAYG